MSNLYTNSDIKQISLAFGSYDPRYIEIVNNGTIERRYLKPLMNGFYETFIANPSSFTVIADDVKMAVSYLVIDKVIARNGKSKTQNLGELENHTSNSKTAQSNIVEVKRDEFYTEAIQLLIDVAKELIENAENYTGFDEQQAILEVSFRNTTGLV